MTTMNTYKCELNYQRVEDCPNVKPDPDDTSMESERYECTVCGRSYKLYYEDMT